MVHWIGLVVPFAYLGLLIGSLATFSSLYRRRKSANSTSLKPWFGPHLQRDIYLTLLHLEPEPGKVTSQAVPDSLLKAALLQRATEDINRVLEIRSAKQALSNLLQRGSVGDDLWQRFLRAEKEVEAELRDVVEEANALASNWGTTIFQSAHEMVNNEITRHKVATRQAEGKADREWWDKERASIQSNFMAELEESSSARVGAGASIAKGPAAGLSARTSTPTHKSSALGGERGGSDEDTVLVEGGGPAVLGSTATPKGATTKKRKGKK